MPVEKEPRNKRYPWASLRKPGRNETINEMRCFSVGEAEKLPAADQAISRESSSREHRIEIIILMKPLGELQK